MLVPFPSPLTPSGRPASNDLSTTVKECNRLYWLGAREAAHIDPTYAEVAFGLPPELVQWLRTHELPALMALIDQPVLGFKPRVSLSLLRAAEDAPSRAASHAPLLVLCDALEGRHDKA